MNELLKQIKRYNGKEYKDGEYIDITLNGIESTDKKEYIPQIDKMEKGKFYKIKVKKYMTEKSSPSFSFMKTWNKNVPMPLIFMQGKVIKETKGMYYMQLHGEATETDYCLRCGRRITNPVSRLYGLGPECGKHAYVNPFDTEEELMEHLDEIKSNIRKIVWEGWVIKSAVLDWEEIENED